MGGLHRRYMVFDFETFRQRKVKQVWKWCIWCFSAMYLLMLIARDVCTKNVPKSETQKCSKKLV